jgi:hypothetical protein
VNVPSLEKLAWNLALLFPECGDEIITDLAADLKEIAAREGAMVGQERQAAESARQRWEEPSAA